MDSLAAVILDLGILLVSLLGRQQVRPRAERIHSTGETDGIRSNRQAYARHRIEDAGLCCIGNAIAELGVTETDGMSKAASCEIQSDGMHRRVVHIRKGLEAVGDESPDAAVLFIGEAVEHAVVVIDAPVQLGNTFSIAEW